MKSSKRSLTQCYRRHLLRVSEQTRRCDRLWWWGGCGLCHDNYMYRGRLVPLPRGRSLHVCGSYTVAACSLYSSWKKAGNADEREEDRKQGQIGVKQDKVGAWLIHKHQVSRKFSIRLSPRWRWTVSVSPVCVVPLSQFKSHLCSSLWLIILQDVHTLLLCFANHYW